MRRNFVPSTWLNTVGRMLSDEPAPAPPTMNSWEKRSAGALTGAVTQRTQTRAGSDVAPSQLKRRGSASRLAWHVARERSEHRAVSWGLGVEKIGRGNARRRRHVLHDDRGLAGDVLGQVP